MHVQYGIPRRGIPAPVSFTRWARAACGRQGERAVLSIRVVGAREGRRINARWRDRDYATNVLSFEGAGRDPDGVRAIGDLVLCAPVIAREAREQGKEARAHWAHMVMHGVLHLNGYDHLDAAGARRMEAREGVLMKKAGFRDPWGMER